MTGPALLVGAPSCARGWVLPAWADHLEAAAKVAGLEPEVVIVAGAHDDAWAALADRSFRLHKVVIDETRTVDARDGWIPARIRRMVDIRNVLLAAVRNIAPAWFLSLDTDVLVHPATVENLIDVSGRRGWGAVGGYTYLESMPTPECNPNGKGYRRNSSYANLPTGSFLHRPDIPGQTVPCDVIMAIKLMTPAAYAVDYQFSNHGEDIGWSLAVRRAGIRIGVDARVTSKHVMAEWQLDHPDPRVGY